MEQCIGDKASVRPVFTFDSGSSTSSSTRSQSPQTIDDVSDAENTSDSVDSEDIKGKTAVDPKLGQRKMKWKKKVLLLCFRDVGILKGVWGKA